MQRHPRRRRARTAARNGRRRSPAFRPRPCAGGSGGSAPSPAGRRAALRWSPNRSRISTWVTARRPPTGRSITFTSGKRSRDQRQIDALEVVVAKPAPTARRSRPGSSRTRPARWSRDRCGGRRAPAARPGAASEQVGQVVAVALRRGRGQQARRLSTTTTSVVFEHDREGGQAASRRRRAPRARSLGGARQRARPVTATTSSPACIGRPATLTRRPSTNTPPMSSSTRACRRDSPGTRAAST